MKVTKRMPSFEGVAAGATATCRLPIGLTYEQLLLSYSGVTLAQMDEVRVIGDGKTLQRYTSGTNLDSMAQYSGRAAGAGVIALDFARYGLRNKEAELLTAIGTGVPSTTSKVRELSTLALEVDINAAAASPSLSLKAVQSFPRSLGLLRWVREFIYTPTAAGEFEIADIPKGHIFTAVHFLSGNVNSLRIERDGYTVFERDAAENELVQSDGYRVPQSNIFTFDAAENGVGSEGLDTSGVHDLRFILDMAAADSVPVIVESIAPFGG